MVSRNFQSKQTCSILNDHVINYKFMIIFCSLLLYVSRIFLLLLFFLPVKYLDLYFRSSHVYRKKLIFIVHSKKSDNHQNENEIIDIKIKLLCLMQAVIFNTSVFGANFWEVNQRAFITIKEK